MEFVNKLKFNLLKTFEIWILELYELSNLQKVLKNITAQPKYKF
jgi:hypothetical protein